MAERSRHLLQVLEHNAYDVDKIPSPGELPDGKEQLNTRIALLTLRSLASDRLGSGGAASYLLLQLAGAPIYRNLYVLPHLVTPPAQSGLIHARNDPLL